MHEIHLFGRTSKGWKCALGISRMFSESMKTQHATKVWNDKCVIMPKIQERDID